MYDSKEQERVWDIIAKEWQIYRTRAFPDVEPYLIYLSKKCKGKILDLGCGNCRNLIYFCKNEFERYGLDFSQEMLRECEKNLSRHQCSVKTIKASMEEIPFEDNYFDCIISIASLHCIPKEKHEKVLNEIKRVSKENSYVLITVWNKLQKRFLFKGKEIFVPWKVKGEVVKRYYYLYWPWEFYKLLKKSNFHIEKFKWWGKNLIALVRVRK